MVILIYIHATVYIDKNGALQYSPPYTLIKIVVVDKKQLVVSIVTANNHTQDLLANKILLSKTIKG